MILINFFLILSLLLLPSKTLAIDCNIIPSGKGDLEAYIDFCSTKSQELSKEVGTLSQAVASINSKINLAQGQINQTLFQIESLEKEIGVLGGVLDKVNESVGELTKIYLARVKESYRKSRADQSNLIFSNSSFGEYFAKLRYLNIIKSKDQIILSELENSRKDYDSRRQLKLEKQKEIESLKIKMEAQKKVLDAQQKEKKNLLTITANDEKKYQKLLTDAKVQLAAYSKFVSAQGGATILKNTTRDDGSWGKYYNQRDSLWGNIALGQSNISVADAGCLITSMAMIMTHYGKSVTPASIAVNSDNFSFADFKLGNLNISGSHTNRTPVGDNLDTLNNELAKGNPVIVGINRYGTKIRDRLIPEHFIVVKSRDGDDYIMNDPFVENGFNIKFTSQYPLSSILRIDRVTVD